MLIRRLALSLALVAAVALGVTLDAQFGLPKIPKIPKAPKISSAPPKDPCQSITDDVLDRALKAMKEKKERCEKERAAARTDPQANAARASTVLGRLGGQRGAVIGRHLRPRT